MPQSLAPNNVCDGSVSYAWVEESIDVPADVGDFTWDQPDAPAEIYPKRGKITDTPLARRGEEAPVTWSHSFYVLDIGDPAASYMTLSDAIFRFDGGYADQNLTGTLANTDLTTCTVSYTIDGAATGETSRTLSFPYSVPRASGAEGRPNTISVSGTSIAVRPILS